MHAFVGQFAFREGRDHVCFPVPASVSLEKLMNEVLSFRIGWEGECNASEEKGEVETSKKTEPSPQQSLLLEIQL